MNRRSLLAFAPGAAALGVLGLAGCSNPITASQLQQDAQTLESGLAGVVSDLQAAGVSVPAAVLTQIQGALADIDTNAAAIIAAVTPQASWVQMIETAVSTLGTLLTIYFPAAPLVATAVDAAVTLVQTMLTTVGLSAAVLKAPTMSADRARAILKGLAAR